MSSDHTTQERGTVNQDLERLEENVDVELATVEASHPVDAAATYSEFDPTDPLASDPTDVLRYEVGLSGLREAVLTMESLEDEPA